MLCLPTGAVQNLHFFSSVFFLVSLYPPPLDQAVGALLPPFEERALKPAALPRIDFVRLPPHSDVRIVKPAYLARLALSAFPPHFEVRAVRPAVVPQTDFVRLARRAVRPAEELVSP